MRSLRNLSGRALRAPITTTTTTSTTRSANRLVLGTSARNICRGSGPPVRWSPSILPGRVRNTGLRSMTTSTHYEGHSAKTYEQAYFYEAGSYQQYLVELVGKELQLDDPLVPRRHILDIGGGTGNFAQALLDRFVRNPNKDSTKVSVIDPFLDPTQSASSSTTCSNLAFVKAPAEAFLDPPSAQEEWRRDFHQVLLKEVAHHLVDRVGIFRGMHQELRPLSSGAPAVLIITRPQVDIDYPLWEAAREVWKQNQPSEEEFARELIEAGFVSVEHKMEAYPCNISFERWTSMVKGRFWSTFSNFSDEELEQACEGMRDEYADRIDADGMVHFEDRLIFLTARKEV